MHRLPLSTYWPQQSPSPFPSRRPAQLVPPSTPLGLPPHQASSPSSVPLGQSQRQQKLQQKQNLIAKYERNELPVQKWREQQWEQQDAEGIEAAGMVRSFDPAQPTPMRRCQQVPPPLASPTTWPGSPLLVPPLETSDQQQQAQEAFERWKERKKDFRREKRRRQWFEKQENKSEGGENNSHLHALLNIQTNKRPRPYEWNIEQELGRVYQKKGKYWFLYSFSIFFFFFFFFSF
jgi:hypothetical protein